MSKVTTADECVDFTAHQWKKDVCRNCMRSRAAHMPNPTIRKPKPRTSLASSNTPVSAMRADFVRKPTSKAQTTQEMKLAFLSDQSPTKEPAVAKTANSAATKQPAPRSATSANPKLSKQTCNEEKKKTVTAPKIDTTLSKSKVSEKTVRSTSIDSSSPAKTPAARTMDLSRSQSAKETTVTVRDSAKRPNRKHRMSHKEVRDEHKEKDLKDRQGLVQLGKFNYRSRS